MKWVSIDASGLYDEQPDADNIKPTVECRQIEPVEGDAVIIEAAYNAYCHQQQQWQYQYGHPAGNPVVESFAFFEAGGV